MPFSGVAATSISFEYTHGWPRFTRRSCPGFNFRLSMDGKLRRSGSAIMRDILFPQDIVTMASGKNRLADETSPYLLQHADNPVDWYPWGPDALTKAREQNKPILLSIGYSACHWCHVMAHESFENPQIAAMMNENFVCIKVDREERPDLDAIYMAAVQMMTGRGGWPMTVFLTPDQVPFYCGTYFPPEDRYGMPGFRRVLSGVAQTYRE